MKYIIIMNAWLKYVWGRVKTGMCIWIESDVRAVWYRSANQDNRPPGRAGGRVMFLVKWTRVQEEAKRAGPFPLRPAPPTTRECVSNSQTAFGVRIHLQQPVGGVGGCWGWVGECWEVHPPCPPPIRRGERALRPPLGDGHRTELDLRFKFATLPIAQRHLSNTYTVCSDIENCKRNDLG